MIYLFLEKNQLHLLGLKKTIMGQLETCSFKKNYQIEIINDKKINTDITASAIKEGLTEINIKEKDIYLILPQEFFLFLKINVPVDIASSALKSFIIDKATAQWQINLEDFFFDYVLFSNEQSFYVNLYAINQESVKQLQEVFKLIDYHLVNIIPETICYFNLFDKTLRKEKKEVIFYSVLDEIKIYGFLYDNTGLINQKRYLMNFKTTKESSLEEIVKKWLEKEINQEKKLNRLIIAGQQSEKIRQDTFTKAVGVWTNPLKRIINGFYQEQIRLFIKNEQTSILDYDVCFGAFLFNQTNKNFSLLKNEKITEKKEMISKIGPSKIINKKDVLLFLFSFILSFILFSFFSNLKLTLPKISKTSLVKPTNTPTPQPKPTLTPTPSFTKSDLKIKILNGSGIKGMAADLKNFLKEKDYGEILTGNAESFDYKKTVIKIKKNYSSIKNLLIDDLKEKVTNPSFKILEATAAADIEIIIGQDIE